ncbi:MAG: ISKra4 family transposase [Candidatus Omnitrophica bacterium]|nr:ISKra4 family transposase [Candidatus Omnitrophota bacterium]
MNALAMSSQERFYEESRRAFENIVGRLDCEEVRLMTHSELERELEKMGRELMRKLLQEHLQSRGPGQCAPPVRGSDGVERSRVRPQERKLETIFGTVSVERAGYGQDGTRSLHPLDAELNLPNERYSLELRRRVGEEAAKSSFDETSESIGKITGGHVPKRQIEELVRLAAQDFDAFYEVRQALPAVIEQTSSIMVMSVDGKGVVMRTQDLREQTRKVAKTRRHKMGARLSKGEKKNAKRMATVAAVYTIAPFVRKPEDLVPANERVEPPRPRPERKRVWASLEKTPEEVIEKVFEEAGCRDPGHRKKWVALVDGNKPQIRILRRMAKERGIDLTIIVDVVHVTEYLWDAGRAFHPESGEALESWVRIRLLEVLRGKAGYVAGGIRRSATLQRLDSRDRKPVDTCANYLLAHAPFLKYKHYLAQGFPVATGVIEGACRHLVKDRMEVTGARWSLTGAEAVLRLRALRSSNDFDEYWMFHESQEYERNHRARYAGGIMPFMLKLRQIHKRNNLKVVK